jgi:hypothetical protein
MLRITSLFLNLTASVFKIVQDSFDFFGNYFVTEEGDAILTEDNLYIEVEENT